MYRDELPLDYAGAADTVHPKPPQNRRILASDYIGRIYTLFPSVFPTACFKAAMALHPQYQSHRGFGLVLLSWGD